MALRLCWPDPRMPEPTQPLVDRLNRELVKVLRAPEAVALLHNQGVEPDPGTPEELAAYMKREYATWGKVVKQANIKAQ